MFFFLKSIWARISRSLQDLTFSARCLLQGTVLCLVGCFAESLASTHERLVLPISPDCANPKCLETLPPTS